MKVHIIMKRKIRKYNVTLNELEIKRICVALNEKAEKLIADDDLDLEIEGHKMDLIIRKLLAYL